MSDNNQNTYKTVDSVLLIVLLALFAAMRIWASMGSLWFDEISSIGFARQMYSPLDALTKVRHDNNHILNTIYLYFVSDAGSALAYRLMSIVTGIAALALMYAVSRKDGRAEAFIALFLGGVSFDFIVYSSEARGYAPAIMFALAAYLLVRERYGQAHDKRNGRAAVPLFWLVVIGGLLSHMSFVYTYMALLVWSLYLAVREIKNFGRAIAGLIKWHVVPMLALGVIYILNTSKLIIGGGQRIGVSEIAFNAMSNAVGAPYEGAWGMAGVVATALIFLTGLIISRKRCRGEWLFFLFAIVAAPAAVLAIMKPQVLYVRYFIVCLPFFYILFSRATAEFLRKGLALKVIAVAALTLFTVLSLVHTAKFLISGRGDYPAALKLMADGAPSREIYVASNHDLQATAMLSFYLPELGGEKNLVYLRYDDWRRDPALAPDFFLHISPVYDRKPYDGLTFDNGVSFALAKSFDFYGPSGATWAIYRKGAAPQSGSIGRIYAP